MEHQNKWPNCLACRPKLAKYFLTPEAACCPFIWWLFLPLWFSSPALSSPFYDTSPFSLSHSSFSNPKTGRRRKISENKLVAVVYEEGGQGCSPGYQALGWFQRGCLKMAAAEILAGDVREVKGETIYQSKPAVKCCEMSLQNGCLMQCYTASMSGQPCLVSALFLCAGEKNSFHVMTITENNFVMHVCQNLWTLVAKWSIHHWFLDIAAPQ